MLGRLLAGWMVLTLMAVTGAAVAAQTDPPAGGPETRDIAPEEWREMTRGKVVTYKIGPDLWAREAYGTSGNAVAIRLADGTCMEGVWSWKDGAYCFAWSSGELSCFRHVRKGEDILIIPVDEGGTIQTVADVSSTPLACGPALTS